MKKNLRFLSTLLGIYLLTASLIVAATWGSWNGVTVGTSAGNIYKMDGGTIGTSSGNYGSWNGLVSPSGGGGGPITVGNHLCAGSTDSNTFTSGTLDTTAATALAMVVASYGVNAEPTLTDSKSETWTKRTTVTLSGNMRVTAYYANAATGTFTVGTGHTFTLTGTASYPAGCLLVLKGTTTSALYDSGIENSNFTGSDVSLTTGSVTGSQNGDIYVTGLGPAGGSSFSIGSSFTLVDSVAYVNGQHYGCYLAYFIQTTAGAVNPAWGWTTSVAAATVITAYKVAP